MLKLPEYRIFDKLAETRTWTLYKAHAIKHGKIAAVKAMHENRYNMQTNVSRTVREYTMSKSITHPGVLQVLGLERPDNRAYLVTEFFPGGTLNDWREKSRFKTADFLKIALQIAEALTAIHQENIVHNGLSPENILIRSDGNAIKVTGFQEAVRLSGKSSSLAGNVSYSHERVAYTAPEQTGRIDRNIDYRTDLYALGVILYEMAAGSVPFPEKDIGTILYAHLTKIPEAPSNINPVLPLQCSKIIMKLLEKSPEYRYQSAYGLAEDLKNCLSEYELQGEIKPFITGVKDKIIMPEVTGKLYGREHARRQLDDGYNRLIQEGRGIILVHGASGTGKTELVDELNSTHGENTRFFIRGKCYPQHAPYEPLLTALGSLIRQISTGSGESIQKWKEKMRADLSGYGDILNTLIPEMKWFLDPQTAITALTSEEIKARIRLAVRELVNIFAMDQQLFVFIDDLQWLDEATSDLLTYLLVHNAEHFALIGSFRDDEITPGHPLELLLENPDMESTEIIRIHLEALTTGHVNTWVGDLFTMEEKDVYLLSRHIYRITQGNPLFVSQLLQLYLEGNVIYFENSIGKWKFNHETLKQLPLNNSLIDLIVKRFEQLSKEAKELLQLASCFGKQFDIKELAEIAGKPENTIMATLKDAVDKGLIVQATLFDFRLAASQTSMRSASLYRFPHDKIQGAVYQTLSGEVKESHHLHIGKRLLRLAEAADPSPYVFAIVSHLNICSYSLSKADRIDLAKWNRMAGDKAKAEAAFAAALFYYETGINLIPEGAGGLNDPLSFTLMLGLGEAAYLNQQFSRAEDILDQLLTGAHSKTDKNNVYRLKMLLYTHTHQSDKAVKAGLQALKLFGVNLKGAPAKWEVAKEYGLTKIAFQRKTAKKYPSGEKLSEHDYHMMMRTLVETVAPAYLVDQNLTAILIFKAVRFTLKYGESDISSIVYINYALTLSAGLKDYENSYKYGQLAINLAEKYGDQRSKAIVDFTYACFVHHWKQPIWECLEYFERSQAMSIETGQLHNASANCAFIGAVLLLKGGNLAEAKKSIRKQLDFAKENDHPLASVYLQIVLMWMDRLKNPETEISWDYPIFTEDPSEKIMHYTLQLQMAYLFKNEDEAIELITKLESLIIHTFQLIVTPEFYYYYSLWIVRLLRRGKITANEASRKMSKSLKKLKGHAAHAPNNYRHKYLLVMAEWLHVNSKSYEAIDLYQEASDAAEANGFLQDTAIAHECAGEFYLDNGLTPSANAHLSEAYKFYREWGADYVAGQLLEKYPESIQPGHNMLNNPAAAYESIDLHALFETATALSSEISPQQLLLKIMDIMRLHSGAERVFLILKEQHSYNVTACGFADGSTEVYPTDHHDYVVPVVNYVAESLEIVLLSDAYRQGAFKNNADIIQREVKSVLCLPMLHQGKLSGILYMENNQVTHAFKADQVLLLTLLSSQAAVALENARWYDQLEEKIQERTALLNQTNKELMETNQALAEAKEKRRDLLSKVTHDLRSPLAVIRSYIDAMIDTVINDPQQQRNYLKTVGKRLVSMERLLEDLMEIARLELENIAFHMDFIPADHLFKHLERQLGSELKPSGIAYQWMMRGQKATDYPIVEVDIGRMEQVMTNLLTNAAAHAKDKDIRITMSLEKEEIVIAVEDQGEGIAESEIPFIFERYYTSRSEGHGLGLVICQEIIQKHGGDIWVTSNFGKGTTVFLSLPAIEI